MHQPSQAPVDGQARSRADSAGRLLATGAVVLWAIVLVFAFWLERNPDAPTALGVAEFVLALVMMPLTSGPGLRGNGTRRRTSSSPVLWEPCLPSGPCWSWA